MPQCLYHVSCGVPGYVAVLISTLFLGINLLVPLYYTVIVLYFYYLCVMYMYYGVYMFVLLYLV